MYVYLYTTILYLQVNVILYRWLEGCKGHELHEGMNSNGPSTLWALPGNVLVTKIGKMRHW